MIVAISRFDKSSWPPTILRCESSFARSWIPTRRRRNLHTMGTEVKLQELLIMKESDIMGVLTDLPVAKKKAA